jgi:hypothetical protein
MFFTKSVAEVYVKELRTRLDRQIVPIFTPDTAVEVGDFGSFEDGRFVSHGNVRDRGLQLRVDTKNVSAFDFGSSGKVSFGPTVELPNPVGGTLLKSTIKFTQSRAVVVSFKEGSESKVDGDSFADALAKLWASRELREDRAVVWSVRLAQGGTVIVSEAGNNSLEVMADSAVLGPAGLTIPNLSLGVSFGAEQQATWKLSAPNQPLVAWVRLLRLRRSRVEDAFPFETGAPIPVTADDIEPYDADDLVAALAPG